MDNKEQINNKNLEKNNINEDRKFIHIDILKKENDDDERKIGINNKSRNPPKLDINNISKIDLSNKKEELNINKKLRLPKVMKKSNSQTIISTPVMISFKKMMGRDGVKKENNLIEKTDIEYKPNYDFRLPHVRSFQFKTKRNKQNHKKYLLGKILRSYSFNTYGYFVMDIKKNK